MIYLVDWNEEASGARFLLVQAANKIELFEGIDMIGDPYSTRWRKWQGGLSLSFNVKDISGELEDDDEDAPCWDVANLGGDDSDQSSDTFNGMAPLVAELLQKKTGWHTFTSNPSRPRA